jgi:hypothetical protein
MKLGHSCRKNVVIDDHEQEEEEEEEEEERGEGIWNCFLSQIRL